MRNFSFALPAIVDCAATKQAKALKRVIASLCLLGFILVTATACQKSEDSLDASKKQQNIQVTEITAPQTDTQMSVSDNNAGNRVVTNAENSASSVKTDTTAKLAEKNGAETDNKANQHSDDANSNDSHSSDVKNSSSKDTAKTPTTATNAGTAPLKEGESEVFLQKQVTDVEYRSKNGQSIKVTFQTSALEALEADVMLPSGKRVVLTASPNQGNNPTYRSKDGSIELVTHGGGSSIDLMSNGRSASFEAVSADAEVISPT